MEKRKSLLAIISLTMILSGCNNSNNNSNNSESKESNSISEEEKGYKEQGTYRLEENEEYTPFKIFKEDLKTLPSPSKLNNVLSSVYVDPFTSAYFDDEATIRYPSGEILSGQNVLYTSAWYSQKTAKRNDDVTEYVLEREDDVWIVTKAYNSSESFIPFNCAVLSIPKTSNVTYNLDDVLSLNYNIPIYDIGIYNQDGNRMAIEYANRHFFADNGLTFIDNNTLSKVTNTAWQKISTINFIYDKESNSYRVDKFRLQNDKRKIYSNVNNGFMIGAILSNNNQNVATYEGVRFNFGDTIKIEENANLHNRNFTFSSSSTNSYTCSNGTTYYFTLSKSENEYTTNKWGYEIGVDKNNRIVSSNNHLDSIPTDGYKLILNAANTTDAEGANNLLDEIFLFGSKVSVSGGNININCSTNIRASHCYSQIALSYENIMEDLAYYNYSYNLDELEEIGKELEEIDANMNEVANSKDPTDQYRYYALIGSLNQIKNRLVGAVTRNEAVQVKGNWYITNLSTNDKDLPSIIKHLTVMKEAGFNEIIVNALDDNGDAYYDGSDYFALAPSLKNKSYGEYGNDYLKAITGEAHKLGLYVYANFTPYTNNIENTFDELKNCRALSITGATSVVSSQGKVTMLDPGSELVQDRISDTISDILNKNSDIDGIALDYIRYGADNNSINCVMGVTEDERVGFNKYCSEKGLSYNYSTLDALRNALKNNPTVFSTFNEYQQTLVTQTVINIKSICVNAKKPLIAAVADNYTLVKTWKCQDWALWAKEGYVDSLYLMDYYLGEYYVKQFYNEMLKYTKNSCLLVTGIDPSYAKLISEYYAPITRGAVSDISSMGYATFGSHTNDNAVEAWDLHGLCNWEDSISPYDTLEKTMKASGNLLLQRCDDIYMKYNNQTAQQKSDLENDLNDLYQSIVFDTEGTCNTLLLKLEAMKSKTYAKGEANNRIVEQLDAMYRIVRQKLNVIAG